MQINKSHSIHIVKIDRLTDSFCIIYVPYVNIYDVSFSFSFQLHVLPREMLGISTFGLSVFLLRWLPIKQVDSVLLFFSRLILGDTEKYGLPRPKIGPLQIKSSTGKTPVLDIGALRKIKTGEIKVCDPNTYQKL